MRFVDIIEKKRNNGTLTTEEIEYWIHGYVDGSIPDYQVSALCMAIVFNGMDSREIADLTRSMMYSGDVLDLSCIEGVKVDKHSTGGVGDKTSLALIPMVASCGAKGAKMSGRGLGHTGGTLDKLESIEGFNVYVKNEDFIKQVSEIGLAIIGQTAQLVPADKKLYALRDVTGTVRSIPLIASSIMSKKLASGSDTILLDVKYGQGAFMRNVEEARELARTMIQIGKDFGRDTRALISDMNQPLGNAVGNALEVKEAIDTLKGHGPEDFTNLCLDAGTVILQQAKIAHDDIEARAMLLDAIGTGKALNKFKEMVRYQHGNPDVVDHPELLPQAKQAIEMLSKEDGYVKKLNALEIGVLAMRLGAGRRTKEESINPAVGIVLNKKTGAAVAKGDVLATVYTDTDLTEEWISDFYATYEFSDEPVAKQLLIEEIIQ